MAEVVELEPVEFKCPECATELRRGVPKNDRAIRTFCDNRYCLRYWGSGKMIRIAMSKEGVLTVG